MRSQEKKKKLLLPFESNLRVYATSADNTGTSQGILNARNQAKTKVAEQAKQTKTVTNPRESRAIAIIAANMAIRKRIAENARRILLTMPRRQKQLRMEWLASQTMKVSPNSG